MTSASRGKNRNHVAATNRHAVVSDDVEKHRLVVEGESLTSSWKNYDISMRMGRRRCRKKLRKSTNFQQKFVWFTYSN